MKRFVVAIFGLFALGWSGIAFAQATTCPISFTCAFSAAESMSLVTPKGTPNQPGQPDVYVGYMVFDGSSNVTLTGMQNVNGTVGQIGGTSGLTSKTPCAAGTAGQPATITFSDNSEISFVTDANGGSPGSIGELQFILTKDQNTTGKTTTANSVRVGVCRKQ
jgi:hypothetical protein